MDLTNSVFPKVAHIAPPIDHEDYIYELKNVYRGVSTDPGSQYDNVMGFEIDGSLWCLSGRKDKENGFYIIDVSVVGRREEREASVQIYFFDDRTSAPRVVINDCGTSLGLENLLTVLSLPEHKIVA